MIYKLVHNNRLLESGQKRVKKRLFLLQCFACLAYLSSVLACASIIICFIGKSKD